MRKCNFALRLQPSLLTEARKVAEAKANLSLDAGFLAAIDEVAAAADLRARPSWRALRARKSKARADRVTTSWALKWGRCGRPPFPIRGFRTGGCQRKRVIWDFELINRRVHFCDVDRGELILRHRDCRDLRERTRVRGRSVQPVRGTRLKNSLW